MAKVSARRSDAGVCMNRCVLLLFLTVGLLGKVFAAEPNSGWGKLCSGMSQREIATVLGQPLLRTRSRGFEVWIYNSGGEVLFFRGPLFAWTAPVPQAGDESHPVDQDLPLRGAPPARPARDVTPRPATSTTPSNSSGDTSFRYRAKN
jgi:hypothetical protein